MKHLAIAIMSICMMLPLLHCATLKSAKIEHLSPFAGRGPCDSRNGPCPPRSLRAELTWDTPGADLDLHCVMDEDPREAAAGRWFSIADAFYRVPEPREVFGGNRHHLDDVEDAPGTEAMMAEPADISRAYTFGVHFHTTYRAEVHQARARLRIFCDRLEVARYSRTLSASGLGDLEHDFWRVTGVVMNPTLGCDVKDIDQVMPAAAVHSSIEKKDD